MTQIAYSRLRAKRAMFTFWMAKVINLANFLKSKTCGQTVLPDGSALMGQKLMENAKIKVYNLTGQFIKNAKIDQFCEFL